LGSREKTDVSKLGTALRKKFGDDPKKVIQALGLDASILSDLSTEKNDMPTRLANTALQLTAAMIRPVLAKDAKIDLMPIFKDVTSKNFSASKITMALDSALKGKLAKDADPHMGHVAQMLDHLEGAAKPETVDASVSEAQHKAMEAAAHGESDLDIPEKVGKEFTAKDEASEKMKGFLKEKGMSEDDISAVMDMLPKSAMDKDDLSAEAKKKEEEEEEQAAARDKAAKDAEMAKTDEEKKAAADKAARDAEMASMVKKPAMDAAIAAATTATEKRVMGLQREIRKAEHAVQPYVGQLSSDIVFDTADDVYRHALDMLGVKEAKTIDASALPTILKLMPVAGARPVQREAALGMDSASTKKLHEKFPGLANIMPA